MFISFLAPTDTDFLVYGRRREEWLRERMDELLAELADRYPSLLDRVHVFGLIDHGPPHWRDPVTASSLKLRVKEILHLEP